jgi:CHAT domain-containing protein
MAHVQSDSPPDGLTLAGRLTVDRGEPLDLSAPNNLIVKTRTAIRSRDDRKARRNLKELHRLLIKPIAQTGFRPESFRRLLIVPHGVLHYVPFAALIDPEGRFLITKTEVVIAPSASAWRLLRLRERKGGRWSRSLTLSWEAAACVRFRLPSRRAPT